MPVPFWCLLIAVLIPYLIAGVGAYMRQQQLGSLDANNPRTQALQLEGAAARALAAQSNAWEALAVFAPAVLVAHLAGADAGLSSAAAMVWLGSRVLHPVFYISDRAPLRSLSFLVGLVSSLWLFGLAATA